MKVVHLSLTPLAGAPIRIVQALNSLTNINARLINHNPNIYGNRKFDEDISFAQNLELSKDLIAEADIVHCHHWIDLKKNPFGFDLTTKKIIRHFHSEPNFVAKHANITVERIFDDPIPQLVVAQFHERLYPKARPVPNLINFEKINDAIKENKNQFNNKKIISFGPTTETAAGLDRWNTKGSPETIKILQKINNNSNYHIDVFRNVPHKESLKRKARSDIVIDEMVTGSYHLSGLEALALGKPTFGYIDSRMVSTLSLLTGSGSLPWINIHLSGLSEVLPFIMSDQSLCQQIAQYSAKWMVDYWATKKMVEHYVQAYHDILEGQKILRQTPLNHIQDNIITDLNWLCLTKTLY